MKRNLLLLSLLFCLFCGFSLAGAQAAPICTINPPSGLAFGSVDVLNNVQKTTDASMSVNCTGIGSTETVRFCLFAVNGGINNLSATRYMLRNTNRLYYNLFFSGSVLLSTLLDFSGAYADLTAASPKLIISIASTLPGGQTNRPAGDYTDTVILNGNYASFVGASPFNDCNFSGTSAAPVSFDVTATVPSNCNIAATPLTFPTQVIFDADVTAQSAITVSCTNGSPYWVGLDNGLNSISGQRRMRSGPNYINYDLFRDAGLSMRWGATKDVDTVSGTGASSGTTLTVYGVAPKPSTLPMPATYTDSVVATVNF